MTLSPLRSGRCPLTKFCLSATLGCIVRIPLFAQLKITDVTCKATYTPPHLQTAQCVDF